MSFSYEERKADSLYIESVWRTEDTADGTYLAAADGQWDLIFTQSDDGKKILLSGPSSRAAPVSYKKGNRNFGVRFRPGVYLADLPTSKMVDIIKVLPNATKHSFWFQNQPWTLPSYDNVETFIDKLAKHNLLTHDPIVRAILTGNQPTITARSVQRHFITATGLTHQCIQQIIRANQAVKLLQQDLSITDIVVELGYADQAHMTRQVKLVSGCTPGEIAKKVEVCRLRSIQGYGVCAEMRVQNFKGVSYGDKTV